MKLVNINKDRLEYVTGYTVGFAKGFIPGALVAAIVYCGILGPVYGWYEFSKKN